MSQDKIQDRFQDRNRYNRKYKQRIRTDGFSSGATFRDGCQPDPQCLNPFQLQVDFAFISSPTNCWLSEEVFRFHPMILAKFRQAGRQLCESHEGEVWLSSEKGNSYKFFIVGNGSNNTRITSLPGSFILFGNLVLVYLKSYWLCRVTGSPMPLLLGEQVCVAAQSGRCKEEYQQQQVLQV